MTEQIVVALQARPGAKYDQTGECIGTYNRSIVFLPRSVKPDEMVRVRLVPIDGKLDANGRTMYRSELAPVYLPMASQYAIADEARQLRESQAFPREQGEALLRAAGATHLPGCQWYYFNSDGIFGSPFPSAALTALEFLPHASGAGFIELIAWLAEDGYYSATQENPAGGSEREARTPDVPEPALIGLKDRTTRGERVLSIDVIKFEQEVRAKKEAGELTKLQVEVARLGTELNSAHDRCLPHADLAALGERLLDRITAPQPADADRASLRTWTAEVSALLAEANGLIQPVEIEFNQLQEAVKQLKVRLGLAAGRCNTSMMELLCRLEERRNSNPAANQDTLRAWMSETEDLLSEAVSTIERAEAAAAEKQRRQESLTAAVGKLSSRLADPAQAVGTPENLQVARVLLQHLEQELRAGKLDVVQVELSAAQQAVELACAESTMAEKLRALEAKFKKRR